MTEINIYDPKNKPDKGQKQKIVDFLYENLEKFGDPKPAIEKAVDYALKNIESFGGFVLSYNSGENIFGAVVVNRTGMKDYIPENILVYIATKKEERGKGIGKKLMKKTIEIAEGSIKLHVEPDNPARFLYEGFGFTNKYLEMRLTK
ncbi:GNAT family N-acetyltransferase [candidate division WOR-3 bacterium]|nr:GNAT family N-acetyltransferase [candidate division WOR-3 bacterium]